MVSFQKTLAILVLFYFACTSILLTMLHPKTVPQRCINIFSPLILTYCLADGLKATESSLYQKGDNLTALHLADLLNDQFLTQSRPAIDELHSLRNEVAQLKAKIGGLTSSPNLRIFNSSSKGASAQNNVEPVDPRNNPLYLLGAYPDLTSAYKDLSNKFFFGQIPNYSRPHYGLINEDDYCTRVDIYNLEHQENMFKQQTFFTDYHPVSKYYINYSLFMDISLA